MELGFNSVSSDCCLDLYRVKVFIDYRGSIACDWVSNPRGAIASANATFMFIIHFRQPQKVAQAD